MSKFKTGDKVFVIGQYQKGPWELLGVRKILSDNPDGSGSVKIYDFGSDYNGKQTVVVDVNDIFLTKKDALDMVDYRNKNFLKVGQKVKIIKGYNTFIGMEATVIQPLDGNSYLEIPENEGEWYYNNDFLEVISDSEIDEKGQTLEKPIFEVGDIVKCGLGTIATIDSICENNLAIVRPVESKTTTFTTEMSKMILLNKKSNEEPKHEFMGGDLVRIKKILSIEDGKPILNIKCKSHWNVMTRIIKECDEGYGLGVDINVTADMIDLVMMTSDENNRFICKSSFEKGDMVEIIDGEYCGHIGIVGYSTKENTKVIMQISDYMITYMISNKNLRFIRKKFEINDIIEIVGKNKTCKIVDNSPYFSLYTCVDLKEDNSKDIYHYSELREINKPCYNNDNLKLTNKSDSKAEVVTTPKLNTVEELQK